MKLPRAITHEAELEARGRYWWSFSATSRDWVIAWAPVIYRSAYTVARLEPLAKQIGAMPGHAPVWCIFDNTASGAAAADALTLTSLLRRP